MVEGAATRSGTFPAAPNDPPALILNAKQQLAVVIIVEHAHSFHACRQASARHRRDQSPRIGISLCA